MMIKENKEGLEDFYRRRDNILKNQERFLKKASEDILRNGGSPVIEEDGAIYLISGDENTFDELFPITEEEKREMRAKNKLELNP